MKLLEGSFLSCSFEQNPWGRFSTLASANIAKSLFHTCFLGASWLLFGCFSSVMVVS